MKILYLNGADIEGGAAKAATRLLHGVHAQGVDARLYVQRKYGDDPLVDGPRSLLGKTLGFTRPTIEQLLSGITPGKMNGPFCSAFLPDRLSGQVAGSAPDIIHLHWVARMMRLETLARFNKPIVWTLHDSWAFTGGCYLPGDCTRYKESCGKCPVLRSSVEDDLSHRVWQRKQKAWKDLNLTIIAPSHWMAECARKSSLFRDKRIEVIPNEIDVDIYKPVDKRTARDSLALPHDRRLILFGASQFTKDRNKGFHLLVQALDELAGSILRETVELVTFGSPESASSPRLSIRARYLGWVSDDVSLARIYSAADVFVLPSIQESLGYTVMEAMACGTPCVAFNQGGVPDLIDHQHNGYLATPFNPADLAQGIIWVLENEERGKKLSLHSRQKVEREFAVGKVAERHITLYRELLEHE
jgi:glycosyltransferase involved in cell wall biosynthesis